MAQKINPLNFRLKKRLNWKNTSCVHNFNDYSVITKNFMQIDKISNKISNNLNSNQNNTNITKTSKKFNISFEFLNSHFFIYLVKTICTQKRSMQNYYQYKMDYIKMLRRVLKTALLNQIQLSHNIYDILAQKKFSKLSQERRPFLLLSPNIITEFSKMQISERGVNTLSRNNFGLNLRGKLISIVGLLLAQLKYDIIGLKIRTTENGDIQIPLQKINKNGRKFWLGSIPIAVDKQAPVFFRIWSVRVGTL